MPALTGDILIVDDERSMREFLAIFLRRTGYRVEAASGGIDGMTAIRAREYDLVITDLRATGARLVFADRLAGRLYVRDSAGRLLVELRKEPLYPVEIGLEPGSYRVALDADGRPFEARVTLREGGRTELAQGAFVAVAPLVAVNRGGGQVRGDGPPDAAISAATSAGASAGASGPKRYRHIPGDLVLAPRLRLSGVKDEPILNNFVLGLVGHSDALRGVQLSLAGNIVEDEMTGAQLSSGFNLVYGAGRGVQSASLGNIALSDFRGAQLGAFGNVAGASFVGAQMGTVNVAQGQVRGAQIGVLNGTRDEVRGAQVGVLNVATRGAAGAQIGVVNYGGAVRGAQIGVVNVATDVTGAQIGVVNFARSNSGASIGVLPLVLRGYNRATAWGSDLGGLNVGVKLGSSHVYTLIGAGLANRALSDDDSRTAAFSFGIGAHVTPFANGVFFDVDAIGTSFADRHGYSEDRTLSSLRLAVGIPLGRRLAVTLGPTYNVEVTSDGADARRMGVGGGFAERVIREGETTVRLYPGFAVGVQL